MRKRKKIVGPEPAIVELDIPSIPPFDDQKIKNNAALFLPDGSGVGGRFD